MPTCLTQAKSLAGILPLDPELAGHLSYNEQAPEHQSAARQAIHELTKYERTPKAEDQEQATIETDWKLQPGLEEVKNAEEERMHEPVIFTDRARVAEA